MKKLFVILDFVLLVSRELKIKHEIFIEVTTLYFSVTSDSGIIFFYCGTMGIDVVYRV